MWRYQECVPLKACPRIVSTGLDTLAPRLGSMSADARRAIIRFLVTLMTTVVMAAAAATWKQGLAPYLWGVAASCALSLAWLIGAPRWQQWRAVRRGGVVKIVGGYKSAAGRRIQYEDGTEDVDIQGKAAGTTRVTGTAAGTWSMPTPPTPPTPPTRWQRIKRRFRLGQADDHSK